MSKTILAQELSSLSRGLGVLAKAKNPVLAFRAGHAMKQIEPALEALQEQESNIAQAHARKDPQGRPIPVLNDKGEQNGIELENAYAFQLEQRKLMKTEVEIPDLKGVTFAEVQKAGVEIDGELVFVLGDFLIGEPEGEANAN